MESRETSLHSKIEAKLNELAEFQAKPVSATVPANGAEQQELFLTNSVINPDHQYPKLGVGAERMGKLQSISSELLELTASDRKQAVVYKSSIDRYLLQAELLEAMYDIKSATTTEAHSEASERFMALNIELYGKPDHETYLALLSERIGAVEEKQLSAESEIIFNELQLLLPIELKEKREFGKYAPSEETIKWMNDAVETLYGSLLRHIPEKENFTVSEVKEIFEEIISCEFDDAAKGWRVDIEEAKSINVKSNEKRIVIPQGRSELSLEDLRSMVVHEIGVHMLRSITGSSTDVAPLGRGLEGYYDTEEGLGKVMEQALKGVVPEAAGIDHYITAGAAYFDKKDFRSTFELKWRLGLLNELEDNEDPTDESITHAKEKAYGATMRMFRGTDELPWFKDLAYYNGTTEIWKFLEDIRGDDFRLTLLLMGKVSTSKNHLKVILESKTK